MEEGEIPHTHDTRPDPHDRGHSYDPAYEFSGMSADDGLLPGQDMPCLASQLAPRASRNDQPCFRLLVQQTSILSRKHKLAIVDGYSELQFGRDISPQGSVTPRIRLKEMQVSKLHATVYWDGARREWGVVDMGSKHGTFLRPYSSSSDPQDIRLSPPRVASMPRYLHHLDCLIIGSTEFIVHIHEERRPCEKCTTKGGDEIPFFAVSKQMPAMRAQDQEVSASEEIELTKDSRDPRRALNKLKQNLLIRHQPGSGVHEASQYVDRSARRRAMFNSMHYGVPSQSERSSPAPSHNSLDVGRAVSQPSTPLTATNIGHRLLMMQGWEPGKALGAGDSGAGGNTDRTALTEPLELRMNATRAGLGSQGARGVGTANTDAWREMGKYRRWDSIK
ncbi:hypothetical protein AX16_002410 [Volvariella volvacea WC 439]|nr:hypothetical protein AX16_002410 [Volvariella volvacea WC 439]